MAGLGWFFRIFYKANRDRVSSRSRNEGLSLEGRSSLPAPLVWVAIGVGCGVIWTLIPLFYRSQESPSEVEGVSQPYSPWCEDLVSQRVVLPPKDVLGRPIEKGRPYFAFSFSQSCCASGKGLVEAASGAVWKPVLVFAVGDWKKFPQELLERRDLFQVISLEDLQAPVEMASQAPQAVFLDAQGNIRAVPGRQDRMRDFFSRRYE
jgi:hypothetical protein